jgi:serine/threonine protein kinase
MSEFTEYKIITSPPENIKSLKLLGHGSYASVYLDKFGNAIKIMKYDDTYDPYLGFNPVFLREISNIISLQKCPFIPKILNVYFGDSCGFTMQKFSGSLCDVLIGQLLDKHKLIINLDKIIFKLVYALACASSNMILHRDVKPQNILINDDYDIALADWGLSSTNITKCVRADSRTVQTLWYRCPEHLLKISNYQNNDTIDMWSVGIIMLEILRGKHGIIAHTTENGAMGLIMKILGRPKDLTIIKKLEEFGIEYLHYDEHSTYIEELRTIDGIDIMCIDFIEKCLEFSPHKRLTPVSALNHPYINKNMSIIEPFYPKPILSNIHDKLKGLTQYCACLKNININNPKYLENRKHYIFNYKLIKQHYALAQSDFALLMTYTDKIASVARIPDEYSHYLLFAISCIVMSITVENLPKLKHLKRIVGNHMIDDLYVKDYIINIVKILKFPLSIKTFITYEVLLEQLNRHILASYKFFCYYIIDSHKYIGINAEDIFAGLIHKLTNYYYYDKITKETIRFLPLLEDITKIYTTSILIELPPECNYMLFENGFISNMQDLINV